MRIASTTTVAILLPLAGIFVLFGLTGCGSGTSPRKGERISLLDGLELSNLGQSQTSTRVIQSIDPVEALRQKRIRAGLGVADLRIEGDHIAFGTDVKRPSLLIDADIEAASVNMIQLLVDPGEKALVQPKVEWTNQDDDKFIRSRRVVFHQRKIPGSTDVLLYAPVADSQQWRGTIRTLSIVPTTPPGVELRVKKIDFLEVPFLVRKRKLEGIEQERIAPFTFAHQTREGVYAAPPFRASNTVEVPTGGILEFGYGIISSDYRMPGDGVLLRVHVSEEGDSRRTQVFERYLNPKANPQDRGWHDDGRCYLKAYEGKIVEITFETFGSEEGKQPDTRYDNFIISNPIVYRPGLGRDERNVVIISLDTLRADHLSAYGYPRTTSPNLDLFSRESTVFLNTTSQAPRTIDSHMSLFTSVYPSTHMMLDAVARLNPDFTTIPQELKRDGYHTAAFTESGFVGHQYGFQRGFDSYWEKSFATGTGGNVAETFTLASDWVRKNHQKKFMMFVHTYEAHVPYAPAEPYFGMFGEGYQGKLRGQHVTKNMIFDYNTDQVRPEPDDWNYMVSVYDEEIRYLDEYVGRFMATLRETGVADDTIVVILSDHGEEFMEHMMFGKHAHAIWQPQVHVPLMFRIPDFQSVSDRIDTPVSLVDVAPTVLDLLRLPIPDQFVGRSLIPVLRDTVEIEEETPDPYEFSENHGYALRALLRGDRYKLIHNYGRSEGKQEFLDLYPTYSKNLTPYGEFELYDLWRDPGETTNIFGDLADVAGPMKEELTRRLEQAKASSKPPTAGVMSEAEKEELKNLGYMKDEDEDENQDRDDDEAGSGAPTGDDDETDG